MKALLLQILRNQSVILDGMTQLLIHNGKPVVGNSECRQAALETKKLLERFK